MKWREKMSNWNLEDKVNDWVKSEFMRIGLKTYNVASDMGHYLKEALKGSAKTANKASFGIPDFSVENYKGCKRDELTIPVIIENKVNFKKLLAETKEGIKFDGASISAYAVNGALHYARNMIASGNYREVIAIGCAGDNESNVTLKVYYVYGFGEQSFKELTQITSLDFLQNQSTFDNFYKEATLTDAEKHDILINSQAKLQAYAKKLNKLMHNHNITAPQRVLYVSGMLLSMQDAGANIGLVVRDLKGGTGNHSDGKKIVTQIEEFLKAKGIPTEKINLMLSSFNEISKDTDRDTPSEKDREIAKFIAEERASVNKQIFAFIYEYIFKSIDGMGGALDIMGEMYSEFLKYALGDGKEIGIVLTPPYVTRMMAQILNVNKESRVMDLATGSAGFLIASMELMVADAEKAGKGTTAAEEKIEEIKKKQLLGVELNAEMFTLAATNMILRGDGSSNIQKGNTFDQPENLYTNFEPDKLLLNPPFSFRENGMPFIKHGLEKMTKGQAAIIIQDSAGSGKAVTTNQEILKNNTLLASIKMPIDLFQPMAGVQTSIYIFDAGTPHDFDKAVKFIDFRNDGYKRTSRALQELDAPAERYEDIIKIFKAGHAVKNLKANWNLQEIYVEDLITNSGADWNFDQHKKIDTKPTIDDFKKTVADYLAWEISNILKNGGNDGKK